MSDMYDMYIDEPTISEQKNKLERIKKEVDDIKEEHVHLMCEIERVEKLYGKMIAGNIVFYVIILIAIIIFKFFWV